MGRILAIDYGTKRVGIAVTDPMQIIATGLCTVHAKDIIEYLNNYFKTEEVEKVIVGEPKNLDNTPSQVTPMVEAFINALKKNFPNMPIDRIDERFSSKMAKQAILDSGLKKMDRRNKSLVDEVSATLILQSFMNKAELP